jgi:hypothetical protein
VKSINLFSATVQSTLAFPAAESFN